MKIRLCNLRKGNLDRINPGDIITDDEGNPLPDYITIKEGFVQRTRDYVGINQNLFGKDFGKVFLHKSEVVAVLNLLNETGIQEDTDEKNAE